MIAGAASARAGSGGIGGGQRRRRRAGGAADSGTPGCPDREFGRRTLERRRLRRRRRDPQLDPQVQGLPPGAARRRVQGSDRRARCARSSATPSSRADGVVDDETSTALVDAMPSQLATWYGPGFFGNETACGKTLTRAHRRRRAQDAALRLEGGAPLQGPLRAHDGDRPRPVRQRRQVGSHPGRPPKQLALRATPTTSASPSSA